MGVDLLKTTVIGSMKKPKFLTIPTWANRDGSENLDHVTQLKKIEKETSKDLMEGLIEKATCEVLHTQRDLGIDVVTDGEMGRNNYIYPFCRNLNGFDFDKLKEKTCRNGKWTGVLPCVVSEISLKPASERSDPKDEWKFAQDNSDVPVKYTLPGPLSIADTVNNCFYENDDIFCEKLATMVNWAVLDLAKQGCKYIQIDEPVLARYPHKVESTIKNLETCFKGLPKDVKRVVHICCGYPQYLDQQDYEKAEQNAYLQIAEAIDQSSIDQVSLEDAHRRNPKELFEKFKNTTIILGVVDVARSRIESVEEICEHINEVLKYFPRERLMIAPDCGLIYLPDEVMKAKMNNMVAAVKILNGE